MCLIKSNYFGDEDRIDRIDSINRIDRIDRMMKIGLAEKFIRKAVADSDAVELCLRDCWLPACGGRINIY